jgi:hypothetical protein
MIINITAATVVESTLMYGIVHGIWLLIKNAAKTAYKEARRERNRIIRAHVKAGHESRLKHCIDDACLTLRKPVPVRQTEPELEALHTES